MTFRQRKQERKEFWEKYIFGWILIACTACNGSGKYDSFGSPKCECCEGKGRIKSPGPKREIIFKS